MDKIASLLEMSVWAVIVFAAFLLGQNTVVGSCSTHGKFVTENTVVQCYTQPNTTDNGELSTIRHYKRS